MNHREMWGGRLVCPLSGKAVSADEATQREVTE